MKKSLIFAITAVLAMASIAQERGAITYNYFSEEKDNPAWVKDVITAEGEGYGILKDKQGVLAPAQEAAALEYANQNLGKIGEAYNAGFASGIANLSAATNGMPTSGVTFGIVIPLVPSASRTAIEGYVVSTSYNPTNNTDTLLIHFTQSLAVEPVIEVPYVYDSGLTVSRVKGTFRTPDVPGSHWTNVVSVVVDPGTLEYDNCHTCYVKRPAELQDMTAWLDPHVKWGSSVTGKDYGNIVHLAFGEPLFTGVLTNTVNHTYVEIKDGAIMEPGFVSYTP